MTLLTIARRATVMLLLLSCCWATTLVAQETRYISDMVLVPVRSGPGSDYRIINRGLPSGTVLIVYGQSDDDEWIDVESPGGTRGWIRAQYLQVDPPAALLINDLRVELEQIRGEQNRLVNQLDASSSEADKAVSMVDQLERELDTTRVELTEIKRVSAAAIELDLMNQQLVAELESERSEADLLRLENVRLRERITNNQMLDGALAVLLGVILAVIAPRLWPRKKRQDGWS